MESLFSVFMEMGFDHISDPKAYDHIIFIVALCAIYKLSEWKKVGILVTAFTIGHSVTLALAAYDVITFPKDVIELLIPVTIILTCLYNVLARHESTSEQQIFTRALNINYLFALFFGLIHGMGFSSYLRSLLGGEESIVKPLFAFNVGLELGQLLIVTVILLIAYLMMNILKVKQREWNLFISGAAAGIAITLIINLLTE